ncbi:MAG: glycine zipper 2TM domain-containing protein [Polaromonas sp.]|uniref:glycine zipper 2TM domain-containing protein n=1 Tax=Polaromonas sp. TaxID=1869339 RepID=UPI003265786F
MQNTFRLISSASAVLALAGLVACAPMSPRGDSSYPATTTYPAASTYPATQQNNYVEYGRVINVESIQTAEKGRGSGVGAVLGGVAGAVVGHQIGGGSGKDAATVIGAVGGAVAGNAIEKNRNSTVRESYRVSVQLDNGSSRAYDVPSYGNLRVGDRVKIENGQINRIM